MLNIFNILKTYALSLGILQKDAASNKIINNNKIIIIITFRKGLAVFSNNEDGNK